MEYNYKSKKVLITGGLGFIGSNLAIALVRLGSEVTIMDSLLPGYGGNEFNVSQLKDEVRIDFSDVRDEQSISRLVKGKDYLFNLAGQVSHIDSMRDPFTDLEINSKSQLSILEACRRQNPDIKIIFTSTRQVYGIPHYLPVDENHPLNPTDVNGINKISGERYHLLYHRIYGINTTILRLTNTYGPHQLVKHNRQGFMGWFIRKVVRGEKIEVFGDGSQLRDLNYVDDVVHALLLSGNSDKISGQIYNLGSDKPVCLRDLVRLMIEINGKGEYELVPFPEAKKKIDIGSVYLSFEKIKSGLGWFPSVSLEEGLKKTFEFYKAHGSHYW